MTSLLLLLIAILNTVVNSQLHPDEISVDTVTSTESLYSALEQVLQGFDGPTFYFSDPLADNYQSCMAKDPKAHQNIPSFDPFNDLSEWDSAPNEPQPTSTTTVLDPEGNTIKWKPIQSLGPSQHRCLLKQEDSLKKIQMSYDVRVNKHAPADKLHERLMFYDGSGDEEHLYAAGNGLYIAISQAWATHGNVVLSPDDIWMAIQLQFGRYVEVNSEALRYMFVGHNGKVKLEVDMTGCHTSTSNYDWVLFMDRMMSQIQDKVKNNVNDDFLPHFSSSTPLQKSLKYLAVMDSMQHYFEYTYSTMCGIEQVGLMGTLEDWQLLRRKADGLRKFHLAENSGYFTSLSQWIDDLLVILDHFVGMYEGKVDVKFWNEVLHTRRRHGSGATTYLKGWLLTFLVSDYKKTCDVKDIPSYRFNVPVHVNDNGYEFDVRVLGGFTGVIYDNNTNTFRPQHSIAVVRELQ